jgi:hypothetical protein
MGGIDIRMEEPIRVRDVTYKPYLAGVNEWLGGEPFPHERARGSVVDRINQPANIVVD